MPRLLRTATRTAVIAGTATAVSNNVSRRQAGRWAQQEQQAQANAFAQQQYEQAQVAAAAPPAPAPAAPAPAATDLIGELTKLTQLRDAGALSDAEFEAFKAKLLAG